MRRSLSFLTRSLPVHLFLLLATLIVRGPGTGQRLIPRPCKRPGGLMIYLLAVLR